MQKQKVCRKCRTIFLSGSKCPRCGSEDVRETFKGKIKIFNPVESEVAKKLQLKEKGEYAIKI